MNKKRITAQRKRTNVKKNTNQKFKEEKQRMVSKTLFTKTLRKANKEQDKKKEQATRIRKVNQRRR